jgi:uncharacterized phage-associated protein
VKVPSDPRAVANLLLGEARSRGQEVSNLKLQKLLFLCHAFYLVHTGAPLVRGSFEAWQYGPVHREVYDAFKKFQGRPITDEAKKFDPVTGTHESLTAPSDVTVLDVVRKVVEFYGAKSPAELVRVTHAENGPWDCVVKAAANSANLGLKISDDVIVNRFKYLWFGRQQPMEFEPDEDSPLVA